MLSALRTGALRSIIKGQGTFSAARNASAVAAAPSVNEIGNPIPTKAERMETWDYVNSVYFGPERDMKNFPNPTQPAYPEPTRLGIVPSKWFDDLYPKLGFSGGYTLLGGFTLFMLSKEHLVMDHFFYEIPNFWIAVYIIHKSPKMGGAIKNFAVPILKNQRAMLWEEPMTAMAAAEEENITSLQRLIEECEVADHMKVAQEEGVALQLESAYRQRLNHVYTEVKKRLDYEVEKTNVQKRFEQEHMVNWIVNSVQSSITPQQEKEAIKSCIASLKGLAAKQ